MSEKEQLKQIIDRLPDYKVAYVANLIMGIEKTNIEEIEPDEIEALLEGRKDRTENGTISHDSINWD